MRGLNVVHLIGHLGKDPELRYTQSGKAVATFSLATSESWKDQNGEKQEKTEWHNIVVWGKIGELCGEFLKKGNPVFVAGKLQTRSYEKDGIKKYVTEIVVSNMVMLGSKQESEPSHEATSEPIPEDDLPF
jgi:single-strand DNA-binding protein